ncbi:hypothetical protein [Blastopirellula retiformator]|uniref:Outer membrane protein beta-barrel domain-containing protein n=1 Tax=Blastopirellula retiformator TaxID=2527970 RepID=A0A5C5V4M9_9BACT|nr:hypothetical protein [Blastopirellula retiformator]TWT32665.1 hypothetical protein Enr8_24700 [Blastopirellula retiformator]
MTIARRSISTLLTLALLCATAKADGLLNSAVSEAREGPTPSSAPAPSSSSKQSNHTDDDCSCDDSSSDSSGLFAGGVVLTLGALSSPWWGPHMALGDKFGVPSSFRDYPGQSTPGYMIIGEEWAERGKPYSVRTSVEYDNDFSDLSRIGTKLLVESKQRWGVDTQWNQYFENRPGRVDELTTGDVNLTFRFAQSETMQFRSGLGVNFLHDRSGTDAGFNFTYGVDWYPTKLLISSSELDWGYVGNASLFHFRTTLGIHYRRLETYIGYDYTNIETVELNGLVSGIRVWF